MLRKIKNPFIITCGLGAFYGLSFRANPILPLLGILSIGLAYKHFITLDHLKDRLKHIFIYFMSFFCISMYWVGFAFTTVNMSYLGPLAVLGLALLLTCFHLPLAFALSHVKRYPNWGHGLFAISFFGCEMLRSHLFTGLPWNLAGHLWGMLSLGKLNLGGLDFALAIMQSTRWIGVYGLSLGTIFFGIYCWHHSRMYQTISASITILCIVLGAIRLHNNPKHLEPKHPRIRIVQPCINPSEKWSVDHFYRVLNEQMELSSQKNNDHIAAIIWPEAAVPVALNNHPNIRQGLAHIIPKNGYLITGSISRDDLTQKHYSVIVSMNASGEIKGEHRKVHLLPFGEYMPLNKWIPFEKFTPGSADYSAGDGIHTIQLDNLAAFTPLLCYEAIFSNEVSPVKVKTASTTIKPLWILNLTNDAWYQDSVGLYQHLANVRFRAIEEALPLVRVANNGISVVIDHLGRIHHQTTINNKTFLDVQIPIQLSSTTN